MGSWHTGVHTLSHAQTRAPGPAHSYARSHTHSHTCTHSATDHSVSLKMDCIAVPEGLFTGDSNWDSYDSKSTQEEMPFVFQAWKEAVFPTRGRKAEPETRLCHSSGMATNPLGILALCHDPEGPPELSLTVRLMGEGRRATRLHSGVVCLVANCSLDPRCQSGVVKKM